MDRFNLIILYKISSKEKKSGQSWVSNLGLLGGKHEFFLCATQPTISWLFDTSRSLFCLAFVIPKVLKFLLNYNRFFLQLVYGEDNKVTL